MAKRNLYVKTNYRAVKKDLDRVQKEFQELFQRGIASTLTQIRLDAIKEIIPNTTGIKNPYRARNKQPCTPGKLTERTGKLNYMLRQRANKANPTKYWTGFGKKLVRHKSAGIEGMIRRYDYGDYRESYRGTLRVSINMNSRLSFTGWGKRGSRDKMPRESPKTLALRFKHDYSPTGIRTSERRPFISPAAQKNKINFEKEFQVRWDALCRIENRKARRR